MNADQSDILAQLTTIKGDHGKLSAGAVLPADLVTAANSIFKLTADKAEVDGKLVTANADVTRLTGELATANGKVTSLTTQLETANAENTRLTGEMADFNKRLATELAKHGIRSTEKAAAVKDPAKMTLTEKLLAHKGVKSLDELEAKSKNKN